MRIRKTLHVLYRTVWHELRQADQGITWQRSPLPATTAGKETSFLGCLFSRLFCNTFLSFVLSFSHFVEHIAFLFTYWCVSFLLSLAYLFMPPCLLFYNPLPIVLPPSPCLSFYKGCGSAFSIFSNCVSRSSSESRVLMTKNWKKFTAGRFFCIVLNKNCNILIPKPP